MMVSQQKVASGIHDSIELSEEKLDFSHEFMMFYFRNKENVFQKLPETEGISDQLEDSFRTWFIANEKSLLFESLLEQCTSNSI